MDNEKLKATFEQSVEFVKTAEGDFNPSSALKLKMYALYKQATEGDVQGKKPGLINMVAREKYKAWDAIKGMSAQDAMQTYVDEVNKVRYAHRE